MKHRFVHAVLPRAGDELVIACDASIRRRNDRAGAGRYVRAMAWVTDAGGWAAGAEQEPMGRHRRHAINRAELYAALHAIEAHQAHKGPVRLVADSAAVVQLLTGWAAGPPSGSWPDWLEEHTIALRWERKLHKRPVIVEKVPGHSGHPLNEGAHQLAALAARLLWTPETTSDIDREQRFHQLAGEALTHERRRRFGDQED